MHIEEAILANPYKVACIIIEPIQAEGGDNHFRPEFLQELRNLCDQNDILLIFDEVQTGIGMTGTMFAFQQLDVVPDIISFGKKTQVCGVLANKEKLDEVEHNVFQESSRINSTFGGNLVDMLRLKLMLEIIENENLLENVKKQGEYLLTKLEALQQKYPNVLSNARGRGLMCAIDFPNTETRNLVKQKVFEEEKVLFLACGTKAIRFRPHLNVTEDELNKALDALERIVSKI